MLHTRPGVKSCYPDWECNLYFDEYGRNFHFFFWYSKQITVGDHYIAFMLYFYGMIYLKRCTVLCSMKDHIYSPQSYFPLPAEDEVCYLPNETDICNCCICGNEIFFLAEMKCLFAEMNDIASSISYHKSTTWMQYNDRRL
jgi:hypothetical protein